jgi:hypothetical protein
MQTLGFASYSKISYLLNKVKNSNCDNISDILKEKRGKNKRKTQEFENKYENFIKSFDATHSHYSLNKYPKRKYIDSQYNTYPTKIFILPYFIKTLIFNVS